MQFNIAKQGFWRAAVASGAFALAMASAPAFAGNFFVGTTLGQASIDGDVSIDGFNNSANLSDTDFAYRVFAGWRFNKYFSIAAGYVDLGEVSVNETYDPTDVGSAVDLNGSLEADAIEASVIGSWPVTERLSLFGSVGVFNWDQTAKYNVAVGDAAGDSRSGSSDGTDMTYGVGANYALTRHIGVHVAYSWYPNIGDGIKVNNGTDIGSDYNVNDENDRDFYGIGITYLFGDVGNAAVPVAATAVAAPVAVAAAAPKDSDGDGVVDGSDQCPTTPKGERVGPYGCSCDITRQVEFNFDSAELTAAGTATLDELSATLTRLKFVAGTVEGHTDNVGTDDYNLGLSERRAQTVADYLQAKGVASGRLAVKGMGESMPIADNATEAGRAQNRRVVLRRTDCDAGR